MPTTHPTSDLPPLPRGSSETRRHEIANALNSTAIHALRAARVDDTGTGLTSERLSLLSVLVYRGPTSMSDLASAEQLTKPAITRTVAALEEAGLVRRSGVPHDRRQVIVHATAAGRRLLEQGRRARIDRLANVLDGLSARDLDAIDRGLALVRTALAKQRADPAT